MLEMSSLKSSHCGIGNLTQFDQLLLHHIFPFYFVTDTTLHFLKKLSPLKSRLALLALRIFQFEINEQYPSNYVSSDFGQ